MQFLEQNQLQRAYCQAKVFKIEDKVSIYETTFNHLRYCQFCLIVDQDQ